MINSLTALPVVSSFAHIPTAETPEAAKMPEYVLSYFAHMGGIESRELHRRMRLSEAERIRDSFVEEVDQIRVFARSGLKSAWIQICNFTESKATASRMRMYHVTFAGLLEFAGVSYDVLK